MGDDNLGISDMQVLENVLATPAPVADAVSADAGSPDVDVSASIDQAIADESQATADKPVIPPVVDAPVVPPVETAKPVVDAAKPEASEFDLATDDLTIKSLNDKVSKSPEFKSVLDKDPELKKQLYYSARRGERASIYDEMFQTPALAKEVKQSAEDHYEFREAFNTSGEEALKSLFMMTIEKDTNGELSRDPNTGMYVASGAFDKAMATHRSAFYTQLGQIVEGLGDGNFGTTEISAADAKEAIRIFQEIEHSLGFGPASRQPASPRQPDNRSGDNLPADVRARLDRLDKLEAEKVGTDKVSFESFSTNVDGKVKESLEGDVKTLLNTRLPANVAMTDYTKNAIVRDVLSEVEKLSRSNRAHQDLRSRMVKSVTRDDEGIKKVVEFERSYSRDIFPRILSRILTESTKSTVSASKAVASKVNAQVNRKDVEVSGGGSPLARPDVKARAKEIDLAFKKQGKRLSDMELADHIIASAQ